jgi:hypothetical protein
VDVKYVSRAYVSRLGPGGRKYSNYYNDIFNASASAIAKSWERGAVVGLLQSLGLSQAKHGGSDVVALQGATRTDSSAQSGQPLKLRGFLRCSRMGSFSTSISNSRAFRLHSASKLVFLGAIIWP